MTFLAHGIYTVQRPSVAAFQYLLSLKIGGITNIVYSLQVIDLTAVRILGFIINDKTKIYK